MPTILWYPTNVEADIRPPFSSMTATTNLDDGSDSTVVTHQRTVAATSGPAALSGTTFITVVYDYGSVALLTGWSTRWRPLQSFDPGQIPGKSNLLAVEYSADTTDGEDGAWSDAGGESVSEGAYTTSVSGSLSVSARYVRFLYRHTGTSPYVLPLTVSLDVSEATATFAEIIPCSAPTRPTLSGTAIRDPLKVTLTILRSVLKTMMGVTDVTDVTDVMDVMETMNRIGRPQFAPPVQLRCTGPAQLRCAEAGVALPHSA
ncbi:MAG: hypothetical protein SFU56_09230 [Capsulimonadales bacterium]|nr:hypothetical protein [Capsulimonadales bacterium]